MNPITYEKLTIKPGDLTYVARLQYTEGKNFQTFTHFHELVEIILHKNISGRVNIKDKSYPIRNNTLVYVPSLAVHDYFYSDPNKDWIIIQFHPYILSKINFETDGEVLDFPLVKDLRGIEETRIASLFEWYVSIFNDPRKADLKKSLLKLILEWLVEEIKSSKKENPGKSENTGGIYKFQPLLEYMEKKKVYNISLTDAADCIGVTKFHFSRLFKKYFKLTFCDYLLQRKINSAITLLSETKLAVGDIAQQTGFNDAAYFSKIFREKLKVTPGEFRKNMFIK